ncbi:hypothetical protein GSH19_00825 [Lactobacillus sp. S2-2]|uniref:DUF6681 family protein n=1 Tax=Lactobacillus sp. S2-2 TaxID=2692917 RepID=UPI001F18F043|nr:DUF6681 family protein [Lactobacillus sp. S2-2]MCF6514731.1 hypothetical protein [Lactobacillus sp. S2-2]
MFTILNIVSQYLSYINIESNIKGRIYTVLGAIGDLYVFYIGYRFTANERYVRGALLLLAAIALAYFCYLNFYYYFSSKQPKFDITPVIYKALKINPQVQEESKKDQVPYNGLSNGIFDSQEVMPATIISDHEEKDNLKSIVRDLVDNNIINLNYGNKTDKQISKFLKHSNRNKFYALDEKMIVPYFEMNHQFELYVGINEAKKYKVGRLKTIGLSNIESIDTDKYQIFISSVILSGGPHKYFGRSEVVEKNEDFNLEIKVAYKKTS